MTENEIKKATIEDAIYCAKAMACIEVCEECRFYGLCHIWCDDVYRIIIDALEESQQYRAIGTVERLLQLQHDYWKLNEMCKEYSSIGTVEELKALKEKNEPKKIKGIRFEEAICPNCESELFETYWAFGGIHCCSNCGTAIDWQ